MAYTVNHNFILGRLVENQIWIGGCNDPPQAALARKSAGMGMLQQQIDNDLNAGLHTTSTLR